MTDGQSCGWRCYFRLRACHLDVVDPPNWDRKRISRGRYRRIQRNLIRLGPDNPRSGEPRYQLNAREYRAAVAAYEIGQHTSMSTAIAIVSLLLAATSFLLTLTQQLSKEQFCKVEYRCTVEQLWKVEHLCTVEQPFAGANGSVVMVEGVLVVVMIGLLALLACRSMTLAEWEAYRAVQQLRDSQVPLASPADTKRTGLFGRRRTRRAAP